MTPPAERQRIAVIGSGISGNLVARLLCQSHDVHLFEAASHVGGHSQTVEVEVFGRRFAVDIGFMVFNKRTYPNFCELLRVLNVPARDSDMSFSVRCQRSGLEYQGSSLNGLFAQRANLLRPAFYGMLRDILRFNRAARRAVAEDCVDDLTTLGDFVRRCRLERAFIDHYLAPMAAAIWSARPVRILEFPARFFLGFCRNHGLLQLRGRPKWRTVQGGSRSYVDALVAPLAGRVFTNTPIAAVTRTPDHVVVRTARGESLVFDQVVLATHADQALRLLPDATPVERQTLSAFPFQRNSALLHTDVAMLPLRRRAWASWNYRIPPEEQDTVCVTYNLSRLQRLDSPSPILLTLNPPQDIDPRKVLGEFTFFHPLFTRDSAAAQAGLGRINGTRRTFFCGAYWGHGFHEDGVNSALAVARCFGKGLDSCTVACTPAKSRIAATPR